LKTLEKINRKGNINSRKKEKVISAQASPISPARARVRARPPLELDRRAPFVGANLSVLISLSLSLSRCSVGLICRRCFPRACPLSLCLVVLTCQPSLTSRPRSPRRGRTHVRAFSVHVRAPAPLLSLAPCSPTSPRSFAPSAKSSRPLSRSTHACRELRHRPPSTVACSAATVAFAPCPVPR
jgi:hypothetical protein